jgi:hypothetical protein
MWVFFVTSKMLSTVYYISSASKSLENLNLKHLYNTSKINNAQQHITGILIYQNGNFLQILEGENKNINKLYRLIKRDNRHTNILQIINKSILAPIFEDYQTGFSIVDNSKKIERLKTYLKWVKSAEMESVDKIIGIIENFIGLKV